MNNIMRNNKLLADFMGLVAVPRKDYESHKHSNVIEDLQYHKSWHWLMPVVQKLGTIDFESEPLSNVSLYSNMGEIYAEVVSTVKKLHVETRFTQKKMLAEFMGYGDEGEYLDLKPETSEVNSCRLVNLHFECWEELLPVIEKIESKGFWFNRVEGDVCIVNNCGNTVVPNQTHEGGREAFFKAAVEFVKRYGDKK